MEEESKNRKMNQKGCGFETQRLNNRKWKQNKGIKKLKLWNKGI